MRSLFIVIIAAATTCAYASPMPPPPMPAMPSPAPKMPPPPAMNSGMGKRPPPPPPPPKDAQDAAVRVSSVGSCAQNCWNESAAKAGCDPNKDDACLCGKFFDGVTSCTSQTCGAGDNLQVLNTLEPLCG